MKIAINAGHTINGAGYGAVYKNFNESEMTRLLVGDLIGVLEKAGHQVINATVDHAETRTAYLKEACRIANGSYADLFLSIHFNASENKLGSGVEAFTWKGKQLAMAVKTCEEVARLGFKNRGVKDGSELYVIKNTNMPAILVEVCFLDNPTDINLFLLNGIRNINNAINRGLS